MNLKVTITIALLIVLSVACGTRLNSMLSRDSDLKPRNSPVVVGEMAPDFTLEDHNNQKVTLSSARGNAPTVLVFYRGYW